MATLEVDLGEIEYMISVLEEAIYLITEEYCSHAVSKIVPFKDCNSHNPFCHARRQYRLLESLKVDRSYLKGIKK